MYWLLSMLTLRVIFTVSRHNSFRSYLSDEFLVDHVIGPSGLLATKARILITNSISFLTGCSNIVLIRRGIILESGSFETIMSNNQGEIQKLM